jgi:signal peptidase I
MHHRLTEVPELLGTSHSAYETAVESFRALGGSMWPWVRPGDLLVVSRQCAGGVRVGDIVLFRRMGALFAHRVIGKSRRLGRVALLTHGDAFPEPDPCLAEHEVLGRVAAIVRGHRHINLDAPFRRLLRRVQAGLSATRWLWRPPARAVRRFLQR